VPGEVRAPLLAPQLQRDLSRREARSEDRR
jgi:hypothetical protein